MKRSLVCLLAVLLAASMLAMAGCGTSSPADPSAQSSSSQASEVQQTEALTIDVSVVGPGDQPLFEGDSVQVESGATALDALKATGLEMNVETSSYGPFVVSIGGVANEGSDGWTYSVNDKMPTISAGEYELSEGDQVTWSYYQG